MPQDWEERSARDLLIRLLVDVTEIRANQMVTDQLVDRLYLDSLGDDEREGARALLKRLRQQADDQLTETLAGWVDGPDAGLETLLENLGVERSERGTPPGPLPPGD